MLEGQSVMDRAIRRLDIAPNPRVTVATFYDQSHASVVVSMLRSQGIDAKLRDEHTSGSYGAASVLVGGVKVTVPSADGALSKTLIEAPIDLAAEQLPVDPAVDSADACPSCGGTSWTSHRGGWALSLLVIVIAVALVVSFGLLGTVIATLLILRYRATRTIWNRCDTCGTVWRSKNA